MRRRLLLATVVSAALVLSGPYIGLLRAELRSAFPGHFGLIVNLAIAIAIAAALAVAVAQIRERRTLRYTALGAALVLGGVYAHLFIRGSAETVVVERFHFVEYGLIALLFYRVWRVRGDLSAFILPALAALIVGTLDEGLQWFVPDRIGEWRDLQLNAAAIGCGLLFSFGIDPPEPREDGWRRGSWPRIGTAAALAAGTLAAFVATVHLGYEVRDPEIGSFLSRYPADQLTRLAAEHKASGRPSTRAPRLSREDQYLAEAIWHVQRRNEMWADDVTASWSENAILERYYAPALDLDPGMRWPAGQRADAAARARPHGDYASRANRLEIYAWNRTLFWLLSAIAMAILAGGGFLLERLAGRLRE